jgi:hypothetical protein
MYRSGIQLPKVAFSSLTYDKIPASSYFIGFNLDNNGKLSKIRKDGTITVIEQDYSSVEIKGDGITLTPSVSMINFIGDGVSTSVNGSEVTVSVIMPSEGIALTDLSVTAPLVYNNLTGAFSIQNATTSQLGAVKIGAGLAVQPDGTISTLSGGSVTSVGIQVGSAGNDINLTNPTITTSGIITLNIPTAASGTRGALSGTDWTAFNAKVSPTRSISTTSPLTGGGDLSSDRTISILQAGSASSGYLSSTDWITFNSKLSSTRLISTTSPLIGGGDLSSDRTISISQAGTSTAGYLSSADWTTFNSKIGGSGTLNYTARFTGSGTLSIGTIQDNGTYVAIGKEPTSSYKLEVDGSIYGHGSGASSIGVIGENYTEGLSGTHIGVKGYSYTTGDQPSPGSTNFIGGWFKAAGSTSRNYAVQLQDGTETTNGGKFLKDTGAGKANWVTIEWMQTVTRPGLATLITNNSLVPGKWYRHSYSILRHEYGGIDSYYDIILLATSTNTLSTRGHRIMRVPFSDWYQSYMFDYERNYYVGDIVVFGNLVYECILDMEFGIIPARTNLDSAYFSVVNILDDDYYHTLVYDIIYNWDYANYGSNNDWDGSFDQIIVQSDSKGNVIRRTNEISGMDTYNIQQSSIDLHEWNNSNIIDNECYGVWNNCSQTSSGYSVVVTSNKMGSTHAKNYNYFEYGGGLIWKNKTNIIQDNQGSSIYKNKVESICRNECDLIANNLPASGGNTKIMDNTVSEISGNQIYGNILANRGKYYSDSQRTKISDNVGVFETGIIDNELFANGMISNNSAAIEISSNKVYKIIENESIGSIIGNTGMFIIKSNILQGDPYGNINGNTIQYSYNTSDGRSEENIFGIVNNTCKNITHNNLLEGTHGIADNGNYGNIIGNKVIDGIYQNGADIYDIKYNDAYDINNNYGVAP